MTRDGPVTPTGSLALRTHVKEGALRKIIAAERHPLKLLGAKPMPSGSVGLTYGT